MRSRCRCSMCPAIHINSRSWLRSSSTHEPSDPPLRVVLFRFQPVCTSRQQRARVDRRKGSVPAARFQSWIHTVGVTSVGNGSIAGRPEPLFEPSPIGAHSRFTGNRYPGCNETWSVNGSRVRRRDAYAACVPPETLMRKRTA